MRQNKFSRVLKLLGLLPLVIVFGSCQGVALLDPQGPVGAQVRDLILMAVGLGMIVILPVFFMVGWFSFRYREKNKKATYKPHWEGTIGVEAVIWLVPLVIIVVLSYLTWVKTIDLDPYKPIPSSQAPVRVQVVSTDWNWLFIYPDYNVASVNNLVIPAGAPITFDLTSSTVMTSFFIPDLGSQIYVMAGMVTHLNLLADKPGTYTGYNMGFSGNGYSTMYFSTNSMSKDDFDNWVKTAKESTASLTVAQFEKINVPQGKIPATTYASVEPKLFDHIVGVSMGPMGSGHSMHAPEGGAHKEKSETHNGGSSGDHSNSDASHSTTH